MQYFPILRNLTIQLKYVGLLNKYIGSKIFITKLKYFSFLNESSIEEKEPWAIDIEYPNIATGYIAYVTCIS